MGTERQDIELILLEALEKPTAAERTAYVEQVCGDDRRLQAELNSLLACHAQAGDFLQSPLLAQDFPSDESPLTESPGTVIGRYQLLERIGEGGMAVVYMAEQTEPIRRKVALKIIKLGMDTRQVIARFEAERQALALMDHPSIAKVLDAGSTETGRSYFVMELVSGVSITEYCDKNHLGTKERLNLFLQVCQAVQHAHTKGIIHRDIKPSNVMVTSHDGTPLPKVIDFGIAKATNQKLTEKTLFTRYAHLIGTPAYMSPEQAELSDLDIDTRSDIYSLGVLLYELLTGTTPFSEEELRKAGYIEMQRVIREQEPVKPSTRIRTAQLRGEGILPLFFVSRASRPRSEGETSSTHAGKMPATRKGGTPSPRLPYRRSTYEQVRGDLDWIVMKTLEKDRSRRYETASGLAEDVRRHLESEPVLARGPSTAYRLRKFLRRHRSQIVALLTFGVLLITVAVLLSIWNRDRLQLAESRQHKDMAEALRDKDTLAQAREHHARGERQTALETIQPILSSRQVGPAARFLQASILVDNRQFDEAEMILESLLHEPPEVAGAAHAFLARILWGSGSLDAEKLQQFEEYRRRAEALLPETATAEAYFLRAMTAPTIKEQLASLDKALQLDAKHYESRRLRAFTYYASRKYGPMSEDASAMQALRDHDPLSHSLRATALRELGRYPEAIAEYERAMSLPAQEEAQYRDLATQRGETLLRMGSYERVIVEAQEALKSWPDQLVLQYHRFSALTALGQYDQATAVFQEIVRSTPTARNAFWSWATKYVFDTLAAGRSWHRGGPEPTGAAFLPLVEAEDSYRRLSTRGRRMTSDGFSAQWSPDGTKLVFSLGVRGRSGVALFDPTTKETELLIVPGKYPKWSPDGRYIAFVRDRRFLRVPEFVTADAKSQPSPGTDEEIWLMKSDGTEPRRLVRGVWPSWGRNSNCVYYHSPVDSTLYSIAIAGEDAEPKRTMASPGFVPSVSPDNRHVAYLEGTSLKIKELSSQDLIAEWPLPSPSNGWSASAWSPAGNELCLGGSGGLENRTGLWLYRLNYREPAQTLGGPITVGSWAPDGTKLVFELGAPHFEIWTADLASGISTIEALGCARTPQQHWRELVVLCTRRIAADPRDAYAYSTRARYYDCFPERIKANTDMRRWSAVMNGRSPSHLWFGTWRDLRRVIKLPFDRELVFSAERLVNKTPILHIAFGQKGRCKMKLCEIPLVVTSLWGFCFLCGLDAPPAHADFVFGTPTNLGPKVNTSAFDDSPAMPADGLSIFFSSTRLGGIPVYDLFVITRETLDDEWSAPVNLGPPVNTAGLESVPSISANGLTLVFASNRPGGSGLADIYMTTRETKDALWADPENLGPLVNSPSRDWTQGISADALELYFGSPRPGGAGGADLWMTTRTTTQSAWSAPVNLGPTVNSPNDDEEPVISPDGLCLIFWSARPGGYGSRDIWITTRASRNAPWRTPWNPGPPLNSPSMDETGSFSPDGSTLFFSSDRPGGFGALDLYQVPVKPVVDFNADGKVDLTDLVMLISDWGKNGSVCDIGPFAWGDGKVDIEDLKVFMTYYEKENPPVKP